MVLRSVLRIALCWANQFMPKITSMSWPFRTIILVRKSRPANVTGTWKATSSVNICPPGEWILNPSLDSWHGMQCCSTNLLLMNVCEAPESKRISRVFGHKERTHHHRFTFRCCGHLSVINPSSFPCILARGAGCHISLGTFGALLIIRLILPWVWTVLNEMPGLSTVEAAG